MKILFHSVNGIGLGHLNRSVTLSRELKNHDLLIATNAQNTEMLDNDAIRFTKIANKPIETIDKKIVQKRLQEIINSYDPSIVVYDTYFLFHHHYEGQLSWRIYARPVFVRDR
jgi:spore coat polysaccharide biosynthesis predicted glycosyltransferase SpsG